MADKAIGDLTPASEVGLTDLFVLEQNSIAKSLNGNTLKNWLLELAEGHGGIADISYTAPVYPSLNGTIAITYADDTTTSITLKNGRGIQSISAPTSSGLTKTYTINYNDGSTSQFSVNDGQQGTAGLNAYVHIKYASVEPDSDDDMHDTPDSWVGFYAGSSATAPTHYTSYSWYEIKGDVGTPATLEVGSVTTTQVAAGGNAWAQVTNVGTESEAVLNFSFGVPSGRDGTGAGTVTSVTVDSPDESISVTGDTTIEADGTIHLDHANELSNNPTTLGWYKFAADGNGHITSVGSEVTASSLGAIANPSSKSNGQVLTYNGTNWVASNPAVSVSSVNGMTGAVVVSKALEATIPSTGWTQSGDIYTTSVSVTGVTTSAVLVVAPAPTNYSVWAEAKIRATAQAANSITFTADSVPTAQVTANILLVEVA